MARFHGAAGQGASRTLRAVRRAEAETRQAAERARDEERRAAYVEPEPLTGAQLDALLDAMLRADALEAYWQTWTRGER